MKQNGTVPPALQRKPDITRWSEPYWEAFQQTTGSRQWTPGGPANIPLPVLYDWLDNNAVFDIDERNDYIYVIQKVDDAYIDAILKKAKVK